MSDNRLSRRDVLRTGGALAAGALVGGWTALGERVSHAADGKAATNRKRLLRVAHLTDVHVQPELGANEGMIACLHHVQNLKDKPEIILNGGDAIMDSTQTPDARVSALWKLWGDSLKQDCSLPVESVLGNHDIFGWNRKKSGAKVEDAKYGKAWALDTLGLTKPYHSFEKNGWHFICLDSVHPTGADGREDGKDIYLGKIDDEQYEWLVADLQNVDGKLPVCVMSHIPIFSAAAFLTREEKNADWNVPAALILTDGRKLQNLFVKHPNVKFCVSGHLHLVDHVEYSGVTYMCNGAVCGGWWKGKHRGFDAGYALLDLYDDGSFEREFVNYGWKART